MSRKIVLSAVIGLFTPIAGIFAKAVDEDGSPSSPAAYGKTVPMKHVVVYGENGRFCGWPANNGAWRWGNEILVCFQLWHFKEPDRSVDPTEHHIDRDKPRETVMARSVDGGETWKLERPEVFARSQRDKKGVPCPGGVKFANPDFAMRVRKDEFHISYDRGRTWHGPYKFPDFGVELGSRTDYIVDGKHTCMLFLSAQHGPLCVRTTDAGKTFNLISNMKPPTGVKPGVRSIMPSTVRISESQLISAVRQLRGEPYVSWIDVYTSKDNGRSWQYLSKVAEADKRYWNGNPPSLVKLRDGRLCVTYGYRAFPYGIRAKLSSDNGKSWGDEIILRQDGRNWDLGYTRTIERPDGRLVTICYYSTKENPQQYIAATIWDPDAVDKNSVDRLAFAEMTEHIEGIENSIRKIIELSQAEKPNVNQIVWWVQNKEKHADQLNDKVALHFMGQRLEAVSNTDRQQHKEHTKQLNLLHEMLVYTTKVKQANGISSLEKLKSLLSDFQACYFVRSGDSR